MLYLYNCNDNFNVYYCRIDRIVFNFTLSTFFRNNVIEDKASIHAIFYVKITLSNDLYSSMTVNINLDSKLRRYCHDFTAKTTVMDTIIITLLILSSIPYIASNIRTYRLAKVFYC